MYGRGSMRIFAMKPLYEVSSSKIIEHQAWQMPCSFALAGNDLFSTLWATLAGMLRNIAKAVRIDYNCPQDHSKELNKVIMMYIDFLIYLIEAVKSPLLPSPDKLNLKYDRWVHILKWRFSYSYHQLEEFAIEARKHCQTLNSYAKANARK